MQKIIWNKVSISFQYNFGQITEKRIKKIVDEINGKGFNIIANLSPGPNVAILVEENNKSIVVINDNSITYNIMNIFEQNRNASANKNLHILFDALAVDDKNLFVVNAEGQGETENSHIESVNYFNEKNYVEKLDDNIYGVGYRFLFRREYYNGEFKIEPMVQNSKYYYYQCIINITLPTTIDEVFILIDKELKICTENIELIMKSE